MMQILPELNRHRTESQPCTRELGHRHVISFMSTTLLSVCLHDRLGNQ